MGYQTGFGNSRFMIRRLGYAYNPDPSARDASLFSYDLEQPPFVEAWGQGLVFLRNPACLYPVPDGFFPDALEQSLENGQIVNSTHVWHPFSSKTMVLFVRDLKEKVPEGLREARQFVIGAIPRGEFEDAIPHSRLAPEGLYEQSGWFADGSRSFFGMVALDKTDDDWGFIVFARDEYFVLRPKLTVTGLASRTAAVEQLQIAIAQLLDSPQRIFSDLK
jgi:hypothetical protein